MIFLNRGTLIQLLGLDVFRPCSENISIIGRMKGRVRTEIFRVCRDFAR